MQTTNEYVISFLEEYANDALDAWKSEQNMIAFKALFKKTRKPKKKKDKNAPKKNKSAYLFFCAEERPKIKEENPELNSKEVTRELGVRWNAFKNEESDSDRMEALKELAQEDKLRYEEEINNYVPSESGSESDEEKPKKKKKKKNKNAPKRNKSVYLFFCAEERLVIKEENPDMSAKEVLQELGLRWETFKNEESDSDRMETLKELAQEDKLRYEEEMKNYVPSENTNEEKPKKKKDKNAPKKNKLPVVA